MIVQIWFHS